MCYISYGFAFTLSTWNILYIAFLMSAVNRLLYSYRIFTHKLKFIKIHDSNLLTTLLSVTCVNVLARVLSLKGRINSEGKSITWNTQSCTKWSRTKWPYGFLSFSISLVFTHYSLCFESYQFPFELYTLSACTVSCILLFYCIVGSDKQTEGGWRLVRVNILFYFFLYFFCFPISKTMRVYNLRNHKSYTRSS